MKIITNLNKPFFIIFSFVSILWPQWDVQYDSHLITTATMTAKITNIGMLDWQHSNGSAIRWMAGDEEIIFAHGLWINGIMNDSLIGTTSMWIPDFSEGPVIDGQAAILVQPEDSTLYRVYHIDQSSNTGDPDYDEWPVQWGAPHQFDGSPLVIGDQTTYMVYNDAHPGDDYRGWPYSDPTPLEIHETVWDYGNTAGLENVLFFRYRIYNRGNDDILDAAISFWVDVDIVNASRNLGGYNPNGNYMYNYYNGIQTGILPRACTYLMLQGPAVYEPDSTAIAFGHTIQDARNLLTTAGMYVLSDRYPVSDTLIYLPNTLEELRYISLGLMLNGQPIIHPLTHDTTTYTFDGDPATGEGWIFNGYNDNGGSEGEAGFITSTGNFDLIAGDSTEVIYALITVADTTFQSALMNLEDQAVQLRSWYDNTNPLSIKDNIESWNPEHFNIISAYPNPFNATINLEWENIHPGFTQIDVFDLNGAFITTITSKYYAQGSHILTWTPQNSSSGIYFLSINQQDMIQVKKITLLK